MKTEVFDFYIITRMQSINILNPEAWGAVDRSVDSCKLVLLSQRSNSSTSSGKALDLRFRGPKFDHTVSPPQTSPPQKKNNNNNKKQQQKPKT